MAVTALPWYIDIVNYLVIRQMPNKWSAQDKKKFLSIARHFNFEDPYLFKYCVDQVVRWCISNDKVSLILASCHSEACGEHFSSQKTAQKILSSGFYWSTIFKNSYVFCPSISNPSRSLLSLSNPSRSSPPHPTPNVSPTHN